MKRKQLLIGAAAIVAALLLAQSAPMVVRRLPREVPSEPAALRVAALAVLDAKCLDCHDSRRGLPVYAILPGPGALIKKDVQQGLRHWNLDDKGHLGADATSEQKTVEEVPLGRLVKLRANVAANTMPPIQYRLAHWGTSLTASEKRILSGWVSRAFGAWLSGWGITSGADADVQPLPDVIPHDKAKAARGEQLTTTPASPRTTPSRAPPATPSRKEAPTTCAT